MSKVVWHVGAWANNYGDRVLQAANTNILKDRCKEDLQFVYIDTQKTYFSEALIEKMNAEADLMLIGGGGLIFHRPIDKSHSGWQVNIDTKSIDKIKVPIAVYGIGYNKFAYDRHVFPQLMWDNIQVMVDKSEVFSVRNWGTYRAMEEHGIKMDKIEVVPDAGMFIKAEPFNHRVFQNDKIKIGLNWAADRPEQRFISDQRLNQSMRATLELCRDVVEKYDAKVYLIEHLLRNDMNAEIKDQLHDMVADILGFDAVVLYEELYEELYPPFDYTAGFFADIYRQMDLVYGMRGHACIVPFGQNTPVIGIGQHKKVKWFLDEVGLAEFCVPEIAKQSHRDKFMSLTDKVLSDPLKHRELTAATFQSEERTKDNFIDKIAMILE